MFQAASTAGPPPDGRRVAVGPALAERPDPVRPLRRGSADRPAPGGDELSALVDAIRGAAEQTGCVADGSVWLEPLPALLDADDGGGTAVSGIANAGIEGRTHDAVGLIDDPANQTRRPLRWDVAAGNLLLVGAIGSGVTSTIVSLAAALCRTSSPDDLHVYVIDGHGDRSLDGLAQIAHCGGVIRLGDGQRVDRLLRRLDAEIDRRATDRSDADPMILLLIDGVGALRRSLDTIDRLAAAGVARPHPRGRAGRRDHDVLLDRRHARRRADPGCRSVDLPGR